jgi:hypothetical protein
MAATDFDYEMAMALRRSHCDRKGNEHECVGTVTIKRGCVALDCQLCGSAESIPGYDNRIADKLRVIFDAGGMDWESLAMDVRVRAIRAYRAQHTDR